MKNGSEGNIIYLHKSQRDSTISDRVSIYKGVSFILLILLFVPKHESIHSHLVHGYIYSCVASRFLSEYVHARAVSLSVLLWIFEKLALLTLNIVDMSTFIW